MFREQPCNHSADFWYFLEGISLLVPELIFPIFFYFLLSQCFIDKFRENYKEESKQEDIGVLLIRETAGHCFEALNVIRFLAPQSNVQNLVVTACMWCVVSSVSMNLVPAELLQGQYMDLMIIAYHSYQLFHFLLILSVLKVRKYSQLFTAFPVPFRCHFQISVCSKCYLTLLCSN